MNPSDNGSGPITVRTALRPGDLGTLIFLHGTLYARERGFDVTFEAYVAEPLAAFVQSASPRERILIAERMDRIVGCIAVVAAGPRTAQLRWFLVTPSVRGTGLGRRLLREAIVLCEECGYEDIFLRTESALTTAARLYHAAGFRKTEEKPGRLWGVDLVEEKYELHLR